MGGFRAKDADRDRYVEVIEAAYVEGQIGDADRELRISRALTAETLDELQTLTRDLQNQPAPVVAPPAPAPAPRTPARLSASRGGSSAGKAAGLVAAVIVGLVFLVATSSMRDAQEEWATGTDYAEVPWDQVEAANDEPRFLMTAQRVRELVDAYEAEFGMLEAYEVAFYPRRVIVRVPLRGPRPRFERWTWDGEWRKDLDATAVAGLRPRVDLGAIDAGRLIDNVATARRALRVEHGRFTHALLTKAVDAPAELNIYVGNEFNESGYLSTTPGGEILRRHPYEG